MNARAYRRQDRRFVWHPYTKRSAIARAPFPVVVRGKGVYLYDAAGRRYFDAISSWWACNLGHGHPRIVRAVRRQARVLQHSILGGMSHPPAIALAEAIVRLMPEANRRVLFASDGSSAVEAALKIAVQYWRNVGQPRRTKFVSFEKAYHGDTVGSVSVGYLREFHEPFRPLLFPVHRAESPCCGTCIHGVSPDRCRLECFASLRKIVETRAAELAGVILEPLCQAAAGMRMYPPSYLREAAKLCRRAGVLLIVDEIAMGFGRTARMFAFEHAGVDPDIVCIGKGLSAGCLPISATVVKNSVYETFDDRPADRTFYHGHTFAGNPIAAAAALETIRVYRAERILARAAELADVFASEIRTFEGMEGVRNARCTGVIAAVELAGARKRTGAETADRVRKLLRARGILVRPLGNVVYLMPPLVTSRNVAVRAVRALRDAIRRP